MPTPLDIGQSVPHAYRFGSGLFGLVIRTWTVVDAVERFGVNVRKARLAHGWTQEDLAERTGLASVQVSRIERGKREVRLTTLVRLVRALDVSPAELLRGLN